MACQWDAMTICTNAWMAALQMQLHRSELTPERIEHQTEPLECGGAKQRGIARFSHDTHRVASPSFVFERRRRQATMNHLTISQYEVAARVRLDAEGG